MLEPEPKKRLNAQQVLDHPWIRNLIMAPDTALGESLRMRLQQFTMMNKLKKRKLLVSGRLSVTSIELYLGDPKMSAILLMQIPSLIQHLAQCQTLVPVSSLLRALMQLRSITKKRLG